ncbi:VOC family protein [Microtetraspora sp. AC03309]|uniref:VOC family protein n=1 Tax=Microtetraspora sp. AC03309 TaxID=2779376 RepID=UPI001E302C56|nr:VOC family protein [Microtetraspora sp. AC03309]MCC5577296.1 VOC family protein [Microtetraspora sp. AC03309]
MISELRVTTVAVSDLERSCSFYMDTFGYDRLAEATVGGPAAELAWQMPAGLTGRVAVLGPAGATTGLLRLVEFDAPGEPYWGDYSRAQDYGHYALNIRVNDIHAAIGRLRAAGGRAKSEPTHWTVMPDLSAWDSLSYDPDGVVLDVFQLEPAEGSALAGYDGRPSELQTVAIHVGDARASADFYGALGYVELYDKLIEGMESFFRLPPGTALHNINMYVPGDTLNGRVEIAQYVGFPGSRQHDRAVPPNIGILSVSLATDDLAATAALVTGLGAEPVCAPVELDLPPYGPALVQTFFGLDGEVLEFYQCL